MGRLNQALLAVSLLVSVNSFGSAKSLPAFMAGSKLPYASPATFGTLHRASRNEAAVRPSRGLARMSLVSEVSDHPELAAAAFIGFNAWYLSGILQTPPPTPDPYSVISDLQVLKVTDGEPVRVSELWGDDDKAVVMLMRSFGTIVRDVKPALDKENIKLVAVSIGIPSVGRDFCDLTGFPRENIFADQDNALYSALELENSVRGLMLMPQTPFSLANRFLEGRGGDLVEALRTWKVWIPPKGASQGLQQGGMFVFEGRRAVFEHRDQGTGAFANLNKVLEAAAVPEGSSCDSGKA